MIIRKFELKLSNPTTLAIAILLYFEILEESRLFLSKIRRKVLTPFKCLKSVKSFAVTYSSHSIPTHQCSSILLNQTIAEKSPKQ